MAQHFAEIRVDLIVIPAVTLDPDPPDQAPIRELAYAHARIAFADVQGLHQVFKSQCVRTEIKRRINLTERTRKAEALGGAAAEIDEFFPDLTIYFVQNILNIANYTARGKRIPAPNPGLRKFCF